MTTAEHNSLRARLDALEAQQAVMAGFVAMLIQQEMQRFPKSHHASLRATYESLFERTIAGLLASDLGFSDAAVLAVEQLKHSMLGTLDESQGSPFSK